MNHRPSVTRRRRSVLAAACIAAAAVLPVLAAAPSASAASTQASHTLIQGSGSSWAANAVNQWVSDVQSQEGMQVVFNPDGDSAGRQDFASKTSDFAITSIGYQGKDPLTGTPDTSQGRQYAYLPIAAGGTAFPYQIKVHGVQTRTLRLSGETLTKIFTNQITNWDDPEITADNNGHPLPNLKIIPVVQSEGSGATAQLTRYFAKQYPSIWGPYNKGADVETEYFPRSGSQVAENGSDGAMNYVASSSANGSIGYVEYSYALAQNYPVVKMLNSAGYYTLPTQYNVAVALEKAQINPDKNSPNYLLQDLDNVYTDTDPRTYPLSSYVYMIEPTASNDPKMTTAKRQTIADFAYYDICQGQKEIGPVGYSPLPVNLVEAGFDQIARLKAADKNVDLTKRNITTCNNPTFIAGHPSENYLAKIAPLPPSCDKQKAGPCAAGVTPNGTDTPPPSTGKKGSKGTTPTPGTSPGVTPGATPGAGGGGGTGVGTSAPAGTHTNSLGQIVPNSPGASAANEQADQQLAEPQELAGYRSGHLTKFLAPLAVVLLVLVLVVPPVIAYVMSPRRRKTP